MCLTLVPGNLNSCVRNERIIAMLQSRSQIIDLRDKLTDAYSEIANMKKSKAQCAAAHRPGKFSRAMREPPLLSATRLP